MLITTQDIIDYKAGWLETHPDETLDDETVTDCLKDEAETLISKLIEHDCQTIMDDLQATGTSELLDYVLRNGHIGYDECCIAELWNELNERGMTI